MKGLTTPNDKGYLIESIRWNKEDETFDFAFKTNDKTKIYNVQTINLPQSTVFAYMINLERLNILLED